MTQPLVCPRCRHESGFDPWGAAARCPRCGYTPSRAPSGPDASFFGESDRRLSWIDVQVSSAEGESGVNLEEGTGEPPAARLYHCPNCGHRNLILEGKPLRCSDCSHRSRTGEGQAQDLTLAGLQELLSAADERGRWRDLHIRVGESDQAYHRLLREFREKVPLRVFECPSCGRQSVFRTDESPYCAWCGHEAGGRTRAGVRRPAIERAGQASDQAGSSWAVVLSTLAPANLGRLFRDLVRLVLSDVRAALSILFLAVWGLLLLFAFTRDLGESAGHKLQFMFAATSTIEGQVVERFEERGPKGPSNYYITYRYVVSGTGSEAQELTNREQVKRTLYNELETGATVTVRYATRDPNIASISGNEGLFIGTTCLSLFVLVVVLASLYVWASGA